MGKLEQAHLQCLTRRRDHLLKRIQSEEERKGSSFDKAEASALTWAIFELEKKANG